MLLWINKTQVGKCKNFCSLHSQCLQIFWVFWVLSAAFLLIRVWCVFQLNNSPLKQEVGKFYVCVCFLMLFVSFFFVSQVLYITHTTLGDSSSDQRAARSAGGIHRPSGKDYKREVNNRFWSYSCSRSKESHAAFILTLFLLLLLLRSARITRMKMYFIYTTFFLSD